MTQSLQRLTPAALVALSLACATSHPLDGQSPTPVPSPTPAFFATPLTVFISDLHFGLGQNNGRWNPLDDFRWSVALKGFLDEISRRTGDQTTLVIAGDFFEMWQHPSVRCRDGDADHGCTVAEMEQIARLIVSGHRRDLEALGSFARRGGNRLVVVPGNHDAALLLPGVWAIVAPVIAAPGKVDLVKSGVWVSRNGRIVAEHGHQMPGEDVNGYKTWPRVTANLRGREFMLRPWGERFVHGLYNRVEERYSLIDNLIPQSNGVRHYLKDQGFFGSVADVARFVAFNLTKSSLTQLGALGEPTAEGPPPWDVARARGLGWQLFARALPVDDWYRVELERGATGEWSAVRRSLDSLALDSTLLPEDEVKNLCDRAAVLSSDDANLCPRRDPTLGLEILKGLTKGARLRALQSHLKTRHAQVPTMRVFVYGHTHELQCASDVTPEGLAPFTVANTGAFQRLADDAKFTAKAAEMRVTPSEGLRRLSLSDLPACYSAVIVTDAGDDPQVQVKSWFMAEGAGPGEFVEPTDCRCAKLGSDCESSRPCP